MKELFVFLILAAVASGIKYDGLRAKYSASGAEAGVKNFFSIPRTITDAQEEGWRLTERPKGPMPELTMYCFPARIVCALYCATGFIAGLQVAFPVDSVVLNPEKYYIRWTPPAADGEPEGDFWTATQYYVSEAFLKSGGPTIENGSTLQAGGVWVNDVDGNLIEIPLTENELKDTLFKKQLCIPNMGLHYYHNVSREYDCKPLILPWYVLITKGELLGVGFQAYGRLPPLPESDRKWFEKVPSKRGTLLYSMPDASECMLDSFEKYGSLSLHIYFIDKPWKIKC